MNDSNCGLIHSIVHDGCHGDTHVLLTQSGLPHISLTNAFNVLDDSDCGQISHKRIVKIFPTPSSLKMTEKNEGNSNHILLHIVKNGERPGYGLGSFIHLLNACIDPENAVTSTCVIVIFAVYIHILDIVLVPKTICADELTKQ